MDVRLIDIHSQLQFPEFDEDRDEMIEKMREEGVATITVGTDFDASKGAVELAEKHTHLWATIGVHPTHDEMFDSAIYRTILDSSEKIVAVGECGIDLFRGSENLHLQKKNFVSQIEFALEHNLPLMIHGRPSKGTMDAYELILETLQAHPEVVGDVHFFVGSVDIARRFLDRGFTLSFDGPITFASEYEEVVKFVPIDMIHAETDAPYASPAPERGRRNTPLNVRYVVEAIARIKGVDEKTLRTQLLLNAEKTFPKLVL